MPRQEPPVIPTIQPRDPYIIPPIRTLGPLDLPPPITDGMGPVPLRPPKPIPPSIVEPRIDLPPIIPHDIGEDETGSQTQGGDNEDPEEAPPEDTRDLPIDQQQFPTLNDPAYDVPIPEPMVEVPFVEVEIPVPDTGMLVTAGTTAAVAAAGAVAATSAAKPVVDFLIKQLKTVFKIIINKILKKKIPNYLDETKFRRVPIELPDRLRFGNGRPPQGQLRLGIDPRKAKKDARKRQQK